MERNLNTETNKNNNLRSIILSIILIIGGGLLCYPTSIQRKLSNAYNLGFSIGNAAVIAVVIGAICFILNKTALRNKKRISLVAFSSIFIIATTCKYAYGIIEDKKEEAAKAYITSISQKLLNNNKVSPTNADEKEFGKLTPLVKIVNEDTNSVVSIEKEVEKEIKESKLGSNESWEKCLESNAALDEMGKKVTTLKNLIDKNQASIKDNKNKTDKKLSEYKGLNTQFEKDIIDKYNKNRKETYDKNSKELASGNEMVENLDKFFKFMKAKEGKYILSNKTIQFYDQSDLDECNKLISDISKSIGKIKQNH